MAENRKDKISWNSVAALFVSIIGAAFFWLTFRTESRWIVLLAVIFGIASFFYPSIAKIIRLKRGEKGRGLELAALCISWWIYAFFIGLVMRPDIYVLILLCLAGLVVYLRSPAARKDSSPVNETVPEETEGVR